MNSNIISFEDFQKLDLRVGKIANAEKIEGSDKLLKLQIDLGDTQKQILSGIGLHYSPEELVNRKIVMIVNLEPRTIMGLESQGMLLAADTPEGPVLLMPDDAHLPEGRETPAGASVK